MSQNLAGSGISFNSISLQPASPPVSIPGADEGVTFDAVADVYQWGSDTAGSSVVTEHRYINFDNGGGVADAVIDWLSAVGSSRFLFGNTGGTTDVIRFEANNIGSAAVTSYDLRSSDLVRNTTSGGYSEVWRVNGTNTDTMLLQQDATNGVLLQNSYPGIGSGTEGSITFRWNEATGSLLEGIYFGDSANIYAKFDTGSFAQTFLTLYATGNGGGVLFTDNAFNYAWQLTTRTDASFNLFNAFAPDPYIFSVSGPNYNTYYYPNGDSGLAVGIPVNDTLDAFVNLGVSTSSRAHLFFDAGVAPGTPVNGQMWFDGTNFLARVGGVTKTFTLV